MHRFHATRFVYGSNPDTFSSPLLPYANCNNRSLVMVSLWLRLIASPGPFLSESKAREMALHAAYLLSPQGSFLLSSSSSLMVRTDHPDRSSQMAILASSSPVLPSVKQGSHGARPFAN